MEDILAKLGLKMAHLITGFIGGVVGLIFGKRRPSFRDKIKATFIVIFGAIVTGYVTPLLLGWRPEWETVEHSIGFVVGIFGMGIVEAGMNFVKRLQRDPIGTIKKLK